jgi:hypothetical protein
MPLARRRATMAAGFDASAGGRDGKACGACRSRGVLAMKIHDTAALSVAVLSLSSALAHAGPCSQQIFDIQLQFDSKLDAAAASGPAAPEGSAALLHRQPTPKSVAHAEANLGDISKENTQVFAQALQRARAADAASDQPACERALVDARRALGE